MFLIILSNTNRQLAKTSKNWERTSRNYFNFQYKLNYLIEIKHMHSRGKNIWLNIIKKTLWTLICLLKYLLKVVRRVRRRWLHHLCADEIRGSSEDRSGNGRWHVDILLMAESFFFFCEVACVDCVFTRICVLLRGTLSAIHFYRRQGMSNLFSTTMGSTEYNSPNEDNIFLTSPSSLSSVASNNAYT